MFRQKLRLKQGFPTGASRRPCASFWHCKGVASLYRAYIPRVSTRGPRSFLGIFK